MNYFGEIMADYQRRDDEYLHHFETLDEFNETMKMMGLNPQTDLDKICMLGPSTFCLMKDYPMFENKYRHSVRLLVANKEKYEQECLVGKWITAPISDENLERVLKRLGVKELVGSDRGYVLAGLDCPFRGIKIVANESIRQWNRFASCIDKMREDDIHKLDNYLNAYGDKESGVNLKKNYSIPNEGFSIDEVIEIIDSLDDYIMYDGIFDDRELAEFYLEEKNLWDTIPEWLREHIHLASLGKDIRLEHEGCFTRDGLIMAV